MILKNEPCYAEVNRITILITYFFIFFLFYHKKIFAPVKLKNNLNVFGIKKILYIFVNVSTIFILNEEFFLFFFFFIILKI